MVERRFQHLDLRFGDVAEEAPIFKGLRRMAGNPSRTWDEAFGIEPRRQVRFHTFNLKLEIEVLTGDARSALASEVV